MLAILHNLRSSYFFADRILPHERKYFLNTLIRSISYTAVRYIFVRFIFIKALLTQISISLRWIIVFIILLQITIQIDVKLRFSFTIFILWFLLSRTNFLITNILILRIRNYLIFFRVLIIIWGCESLLESIFSDKT
jgi:hypothetical protein